MEALEALESYVNGNIKTVKEWLNNSGYTLGEFLEIYVENYDSSIEDIILFVKALG